MINNLIRGAVCALMAALALSCGKENIEPEVPEATEPQEKKVVTFTGRFAEDPADDTKIGLDYDMTNKKVAVSFTGGENIITYAAGNEATNVLKESDVNADGSVDFSIWFESSSDPYCFFVADKGNTYSTIFKVNPGPVMYCRSDAYNTIAAGRIPHLAWGKCNPGETNVKFQNVLCLIRYTTATEEAAYVDFCGNDGEKLIGMLGINYSNGTVSLHEEEGVEASTTVRSYIAGPGKDNYIALMPGVNLSKGFLIKVYDKDGNELYICRDNSSFSTTAGKIIDLGTLEDHKASQYNLWLSGYDIEINGVKYNKETYGDATLVKKGTTFGGKPGVYFINGEATMGTIYGSSGNVIVCSNSASSRAKINFSNNTELVACKLVAFKGLDIESLTSGYALASSGTTEHLTFDNCKLTLHSNLMDLSGTSAIEYNIEMADCDVITDITAGSNCCLFYTGAKQDQFTISSLSFKNNIFWSKYPSVVFSILTTDGTVAGLAANNVYLENNTFYNVDSGSHSAGLAKSKPFIMLGAVKETCSMKANLAYSEYGVDAGSTSRAAYLLGCYSTDYASQVDMAKLLADTPAWYGYSSTLGGLCIYTDSAGNLSYLQTGMTSLTTDPYDTIDPTTGSYSKKASYADYGAER